MDKSGKNVIKIGLTVIKFYGFITFFSFHEGCLYPKFFTFYCDTWTVVTALCACFTTGQIQSLLNPFKVDYLEKYKGFFSKTLNTNQFYFIVNFPIYHLHSVNGLPLYQLEYCE